MKSYLYDNIEPFAVDVDGWTLKIRKGDVIQTFDDRTYMLDGQQFKIGKDSLKKYFARIYSPEEQQMFDRFWENAAIASMQASITGDIIAFGHNTKVKQMIADVSFVYADMMLERLKDKIF